MLFLRRVILRTKKLTRQECHLRWMRQERYWQEQQPWACYLGAGLRLILTAILHSSSFCTSFRFGSKCDSTSRASLRENTGHRNILAKHLHDTQFKHSRVVVTTWPHTGMMEASGRLIEKCTGSGRPKNKLAAWKGKQTPIHEFREAQAKRNTNAHWLWQINQLCSFVTQPWQIKTPTPAFVHTNLWYTTLFYN